MYGYHIPSIPKWIEPWESLNSPKTAKYPFHMISPHPRWRTHSIFNNCSWLRETYEQEVTINASDAAARHQDRRHGRAVERPRRVVVPAYVTERCMPGVLVLHEGAWLDLDENGVDRSGNAGHADAGRAEPGRGLRLQHRAVRHPQATWSIGRAGTGWRTARAHVFRREL
jgi:anaerobic dimethyl sulfoxide reductase subunit A